MLSIESRRLGWDRSPKKCVSEANGVEFSGHPEGVNAVTGCAIAKLVEVAATAKLC